MQPNRVPVLAGERCIQLADAARVARLTKHPNVVVIRRRKDRQIVELQIHAVGDDSREPARLGNPLKYSHHGETDTNPSNVWTLKRIPSHARHVFTAVLDECRRMGTAA